MSHEKVRRIVPFKDAIQRERPLSERRYLLIRELAGAIEHSLLNIPAYQAEPDVGFCDLDLQKEFVGKHVQFFHGNAEWGIEVSSCRNPAVVEQRSLYIRRRQLQQDTRPKQRIDWISEWDEHLTIEYSQQSKSKNSRKTHIEFTSAASSYTLYTYEKASEPASRFIQELQKTV